MRKVLFLLILLIASTRVFAQQKPVKKLMQQFRYQEAIAWLEEQPETIENLILKAENQQKLYDYYGATLTYEKALARDSTQLPIIIALAETSYKDGDTDKSLKYWTKALQLSPDNIYLQTNEAIAHYRKGNWRETIESSKKVFKTDSIFLLMRMSGDASLQLLNIDSALFYYNKAIEKNPSDHIAVKRLADFYYSTKVFSEAIEVTGNYLDSINPHQKNVGQLHGMALYSNGDYKKAIERLELNTQLGDSTYTTSYFLGMSYYALKHYYESIPWLERAYIINAKDVNLLYYYGTALSRTYDRKKGVEILQEGVDLIEKQLDMMYDFDISFANAYQSSRNHSEALKYFKSALARKPEKSILLYNIARLYEIIKNHKNALNYYERFLKTKPKSLDTQKSIDILEDDHLRLDDFFYITAEKRITKLKEELFFKEGDKK